MIMPAALPQVAPEFHRRDPWGLGDCGSVCQLQLTRLVHQGTAGAGWLAYHPTPQRRHLLEALAPGVSTADVPKGSALTAVPFLDRLLEQATEVRREVWVFCHRSLTQPQGTLYGLRFREPLSTEWADLVLWQPQPMPPISPGSMMSTNQAEGTGVKPCESAASPWSWPSLQTEVSALQTAMCLDQTHAQRQQQINHYHTILRRLEHQLRHPLAMIHLYAANLHNSLTQDRDRQQAQTIREAVGHLSDQLTDLIAGCQRSQVQAEVCSVSELWAEAWQGLWLSAQTKQVELVLTDRPLALAGDRAQLAQAFSNLLHNALCFSPPQGQISVQWQAFQREAVITLADQGPGLSPTDLQHMFRPYYSNRPQGSGLGLTIARQIVQQHGGKLWAENLPQGGAQFSMVLPLSPF